MMSLCVDRYGHGDDDYRWLDASELESQIRMRQPYGAIYSPHCAVVNPAQLVRGLAEAVERKGVVIYEKSPVSEFQAGRIQTSQGELKAKIMVPALEGYSGSLGLLKGYLLPVQSSIIATEILTDAQWDEIGLANRPAFCDGGRFVTYGQKSPDGRLVFGARGGYQFGARPRSSFGLHDPEFDIRRELLIDLLPALKDVAITHGWGGTLGMARRFAPHVIFDPSSGIGMAGGYGGGGVGASNLFGRTLADLILDRDTDLTQMPWVTQGSTLKHSLRKWEPEPLPWLTYKTILSLYSWEESLYQSSTAPRWRKSLAGSLSQAFSRLIS